MLPAFRHLDKEGQGVLSIPVLREYASLCRSNNLEDAVLEAVLSEADLEETGVRPAQFASFTRALVDKAAWYLSWPLCDSTRYPYPALPLRLPLRLPLHLRPPAMQRHTARKQMYLKMMQQKGTHLLRLVQWQTSFWSLMQQWILCRWSHNFKRWSRVLTKLVTISECHLFNILVHWKSAQVLTRWKAHAYTDSRLQCASLITSCRQQKHQRGFCTFRCVLEQQKNAGKLNAARNWALNRRLCIQKRAASVLDAKEQQAQQAALRCWGRTLAQCSCLVQRQSIQNWFSNCSTYSQELQRQSNHNHVVKRQHAAVNMCLQTLTHVSILACHQCLVNWMQVYPHLALALALALALTLNLT